MYPDAASAYPELGKKSADAVYLVFARNAMPAGTVGLLLAGLFASSMSSMDTALNKNAGIFVRSLYQPYFAKRDREPSDARLLWISRIASLVGGALAIGFALYFSSLRELSLFNLMMSVSVMIQVPLLVPLIVGMFVKKTPSWAPWVTVALGLFVSWLVLNVLTADLFAQSIGLEPLTDREADDLHLILTIAGHIIICLLYTSPSPRDRG